jgi:YVTN family beta-propeller protein
MSKLLSLSDIPATAGICRTKLVLVALALFALGAGSTAFAQGFPNVARTEGELLAGPVAPLQGRTAIIAWHGERIVTVPEAPGSISGVHDVLMRVIDINDPTNPQVTVYPAHATGFHAHAYFKYGEYLYVGPHCLTETLQPCGSTGEPSVFRDSLRIGGPGMTVGSSNLTRASMEQDAGLAIGGIGKSGTQSPWGAEDWWSYSAVEGNGWLAVRRNLADYIYDWGNGGIPNGPAITASWDQLSETGVIGFPFIMGNILIYTADMTGTGVAAYDISDLSNPVLLDVLKEENPGGYWPEVYGSYVFFPRRDNEGGPGADAGFMVVDFSDPTDLRVVADRNLPGSNQYVTFQDEYAFMNNYKIDMRTFDVELELATVPGVIDASQFALPVGNLLVTGGYGTDGPGVAIWAHQAAPDQRSPYVLYHVPANEQTNYSVDCPITLSIPETLKTETIVDGVSLIVRPVGGDPVSTWHSFSQGKLLTVTPVQPLQPDTTYEVVLTSDIEDAAGNGLEPYSFRFSTGGGLAGGNQAPVVDSIEASPSPSAPNNQVTISWTGNDPDGGSVEYRADFGDGTPRTDWATDLSAAHTYTEAGHYQVTIQARDDLGAVAAASRTVTVVDTPTQTGSTASSQLALNDTLGRLYVANPDSNTVSCVESATNGKLWETSVGNHPVGVALANDGTLWVVSRDSDQIDIVDASTGANVATLSLSYGSRPVAIAPIPGAATMLVTCEGDQSIRRFNVATRTQNAELDLGPSPRAIAVTADGSRALVTRFISGQHTGSVYDINLSGDMNLTRTITLVRDHTIDSAASSRGVPNYLAGIRITPDGQFAWVVGKKDNTTRGTFFADTMIPGQDNTVRAKLLLIDLNTNSEVYNLRLDIDNSDSPTAIAFSPLGDYAFITLQGNAQVAVIDVLDFMRQDSPGTIHSRWTTGLAPQAVLYDEANGHLFVNDFMDRTVTSMEVGDFLNAGSPNVQSTAIDVVERELFAEPVLRGKQIFYHASDPRMSAEGYISCATCHIDGGHDGRTFDFTNRGEGFRNTTDLRGRSGMGHGLVHWSANFDEIQDFENDIRNAFGGTGFLTDSQFATTEDTLGTPKAGLNEELDALAAYVTSLGSASLPRSPYRADDGSLTAEALAGQVLFGNNQCGICHSPSTDFTNQQMSNIGTIRQSSGQRLGGALTGIDTPTLLGLHDSAPYFHDGSAATLEEIFTVTGGRLAQAEDGITGNGAFANDIGWEPMKDWHGGQFVEIPQNGTLTFNDVNTAGSGPGFVEVRYNSLYGEAQLSVTVNGVGSAAALLATPGIPEAWRSNEWRSIRIPVTYASGVNTVVFTKTNAGGNFKIDDILFSTPDDAALANSHTLGIDLSEQNQIVAYLLSLDGTDALTPAVEVERISVIASGGTDNVQLPDNGTGVDLTYTIRNNGAGPLNIGQFIVQSTPPGVVTIEQHPAPHVLAGESTTMDVRIALPAVAVNATIEAWTDDATVNNAIQWTIEGVTPNLEVEAWKVY